MNQTSEGYDKEQLLQLMKSAAGTAHRPMVQGPVDLPYQLRNPQIGSVPVVTSGYRPTSITEHLQAASSVKQPTGGEISGLPGVGGFVETGDGMINPLPSVGGKLKTNDSYAKDLVNKLSKKIIDI